jgi:histidine triad (HIT) family protein
MSDCLFCKIIAGDIPSDKVYEDENVYAFRDINPAAPLHVLIIPKKHIATLNELDSDSNSDDSKTMGNLFVAAKKIAAREGYTEVGYRTVINCGEDAGQTVFHLHLHLLAGRHLSWPPG